MLHLLSFLIQLYLVSLEQTLLMNLYQAIFPVLFKFINELRIFHFKVFLRFNILYAFPGIALSIGH